MRVSVKIFDWQGFHSAEQIVPESAHGALAYVDHDPVVGKGGDHAQRHDAHKLYEIGRQSAEVPGSVLKHGGDVIVHQLLGEGGSHNGRDGGDQNTGKYNKKRYFIIMKHVPDYPVDQPGGCIHTAFRFFCVCFFVHGSVFLLSVLRPAGRSRRCLQAVNCRYPDKSRWSSEDSHVCRTRRCGRRPAPGSCPRIPHWKHAGR